MLDKIWFLNIYLASQILIILGLASMTFLYFDLWKHKRSQTKKSNPRIYLQFFLGSLLLMFSFVLNLISALNQNLIPDTPRFLVLFLQFSGLLFILISAFKEKIPGVPKIKIKNKNNTLIIPALLLLLIPFINFILSILISFRAIYKLKYGWSKEYKALSFFWMSFSAFLFIQFLTILGFDNLTWLEILTAKYSILWIFSQILLLIATAFLFRWVYIFLSFRITLKIFFSIWQFIIIIAVFIASTFSIFTIQATETQLFDLLHKNANMVKFNIGQLKDNNIDILNSLKSDSKLIQAILSDDSKEIKNKFDNFISNNSYLDRIIAADNNAILIYDTDNPERHKDSLSSNLIIKKSLIEKNNVSGFSLEEKSTKSGELFFQVSMPIKHNQKIIGVITTFKRINDNYLDILKKETDQEIMIYVKDEETQKFTRSASTFLEKDQITRAINTFLDLNDDNYIDFINPQNDKDNELYLENTDTNQSTENLFTEYVELKFAKLNILTIPYYTSILDIKDISKNSQAKILIANKQSLVIDSTKQALFNTFVITLILLILSTYPAHKFAEKISKEV